MKKDAYYFSHDGGARYDPKIIAMRSIHGWKGYGWYWAIVEMMRENKHFRLPLTQYDKLALIKELEMDEKTLARFLDDCTNIGLFCVEQRGEGQFLISKSFLKRMKVYNQKLLNYKRSGSLGGKASVKRRLSIAQPLKERKGKEIKGKEKKEKKHTHTVCDHFAALWEKYPKRVGKKEALRHYGHSVITYVDRTRIDVALDNYLASDTVHRGYVQNAATWFNNWEDWVEVNETKAMSEDDKAKEFTRYMQSLKQKGVKDVSKTTEPKQVGQPGSESHGQEVC